jgi:hypothetical protein
MKILTFIFFLTGILCNFAFAEKENEDKNSGSNIEKTQNKTPANSKNFNGNIDFFSGYNDTRYVEGLEQDDKPYVGLKSNVLFKDLTFFGVSEENKFGLNAELQVNSFDKSNPLQIKEANFLISGKEMGTRIFGFQKPITSKLKINTSTFAGVSGGINGNWQEFIRYPFLKSKNIENEKTSATFITRPDLPLESGITSIASLNSFEKEEAFQDFEGNGESNLGISYVGDRKAGFRFGFSYFPDNKTNLLIQKSTSIDAKGDQFDSEASSTYLKNIIATGLNFYNNFNDFELAFSALFEHAGVNSKNIKRDDLNAFSLGFNAGYLGFMIGGSFANYGSSMKIRNPLIQGSSFNFNQNGTEEDVNFAYVYDVGIGYSIDKYTANVSYIQSRFAGNYFWANAISFETKVRKNLFNYIQVARYQFSPSNQFPSSEVLEKTSSFVVTAGIKYKF